MVGPRRVRIASGLRDPPRHVVVTPLDLLQQVKEVGTDLRWSCYKVNIDLMRITCLDIDIAPTLTSFGTSGRTAASDDLSDDDVPFS